MGRAGSRIHVACRDSIEVWLASLKQRRKESGTKKAEILACLGNSAANPLAWDGHREKLTNAGLQKEGLRSARSKIPECSMLILGMK